MFGVPDHAIWTNADIRRVFIKSACHPIYFKEDLESVFLKRKIINEGDCYNLEDVDRILGFNVYKFPRPPWSICRKDYNITIFHRGKIDEYYLKKDIDALRLKQLEYREFYYTSNEVKEKINVRHSVLRKNDIPFLKADGLIKAAFSNLSIFGIYPKTVIDSFIEKGVFKKRKLVKIQLNKEMKAELKQIDYKGNLIQAFEMHLKAIDAPCEPNSQTTKAWFAHCNKKLTKTNFNKNLETRKCNVRYYVNSTFTLFKFLQNRELSSIGANEINFSLLQVTNLSNKERGILYAFFVMRYHQVKGKEQVVFKPGQLHNPYHEEPKTRRPKDIYQFGEYINLLNYATDLSIHKGKAINDSLSKIKNKKTNDYASAWLYVLTSLNNAWRHTDIIYNLTQLDLRMLKIRSIEELLNKDLTLDEAKTVIAQIMAEDKSHTKTDATAQFNCSDEVAIPLATAAIICTLISQKLHLGNEIVCFNNENNGFSDWASKAFFAEFKDEFHFGIQKMNRSLLTYTYLILIEKGYGGAALEVAKRLRGHYGFETTNIYLKIPQDKLDQLVLQLFARRNFGYIQHAFLNLLYGAEPDREKRTNDILNLNTKFNIHQVQATTGFIMKVNAERQTVMEKILTMGLDKARELYFKLGANLLPSKEKDVQCLISETVCEQPKLEKCRGCCYAIPNFYVTIAIVQSFTDFCKQFRDAYRTKSETQKNKLNNLLYKEVVLLQEACDTFGYEIVMSFFQGGEKEYDRMLELLDGADTLEAYNNLASRQEEENGYYNT